ncbi:MAG: 16S rRNA processing protein RimM [Clostridiales bacterium]|nr:16S rRNA processing protein RimM [Candidatus Crickella caballi]
MKTRDQSELVNIGRIGAAVGLRGEVRVNLFADDSDNLKEGKVLLLNNGSSLSEHRCIGIRHQGGGRVPVIRLEGVEDRNAAEALRGMELSIYAEELEPLPEGQHYVRDIVGYAVYDRTGDVTIGVLEDVIQNTAQSVLDIRSEDGKQILVPAVDAFLKLIDDERHVIELELIPGFY